MIQLVKDTIDENDIQVIGLWKNLPANYKGLIANKLDIATEDKILLLKYIMKYANTYKEGKDGYYCYLKKSICDSIQNIIEGQPDRNEKYVTNFVKYFKGTERQKVAGSTNNKYSYEKANHQKAQKFLRDIIAE